MNKPVSLLWAHSPNTLIDYCPIMYGQTLSSKAKVLSTSALCRRLKERCQDVSAETTGTPMISLNTCTCWEITGLASVNAESLVPARSQSPRVYFWKSVTQAKSRYTTNEPLSQTIKHFTHLSSLCYEAPYVTSSKHPGQLSWTLS